MGEIPATTGRERARIALRGRALAELLPVAAEQLMRRDEPCEIGRELRLHRHRSANGSVAGGRGGRPYNFASRAIAPRRVRAAMPPICRWNRDSVSGVRSE